MDLLLYVLQFGIPIRNFGLHFDGFHSGAQRFLVQPKDKYFNPSAQIYLMNM